MKLKIGKDLVNKEFVLVIPNQISMVFDFDFTYVKLMGKDGTRTIDIDKSKIQLSYWHTILNFGDNKFSIYSGNYRIAYMKSDYIYLNHHHIKNIIGFLIENVPFNMNDYNYEDVDKIKDVKIYTNRFIVTDINDLGHKIDIINQNNLNVWQYYIQLRSLKNEIS